MTGERTIAQYLVDRLRTLGVEHIFGVAGDFVLSFMEEISAGGISLINTCDEQGAGFAADAYARLRGLGAVCVTYGVGGLKLANSTAQAFSEHSPVVVLSGAPGMAEREKHALIHHCVRDFDSQLRVFQELTVASAVLSSAVTAASEIDRVLETALREKRPVYLELPRDCIHKKISSSHLGAVPGRASDPEVLNAALAEVAEKLRHSKHPVVILGEELHRFALQEEMISFLHRANIPAAATILGKSVVDEDEPLYLGVYQGRLGTEEVRYYVESSDLVLLLGVMMTDMNLGLYTARLDRGRCIHAVAERISVGYHLYEDVLFHDFIRGLTAMDVPRKTPAREFEKPGRNPHLSLDPDAPLTSVRVFEKLDAFLDSEMIIVADPGDALFGSAGLRLHRSSGFLAPAYYASLGFAVPAAIGAGFAAPALRPLVLVGDGAFQMTGMELSTVARYGLNPIVILLNNRGYTTERYIRDGSFNDIHNWRYSEIPRLLDYGRGVLVRNEGELDHALEEAQRWRDTLFLIEISLDRMDATPSLRRLGSGLHERGG